MKTLFVILAVLAAVVVLLMITGLFLKKEYTVSRAITINKSKTNVFDFIKLLKNQNEYSYWATMDPALRKEFRGTDGASGFVSAWDSDDKNVGKGEQEILKVVDGERIDYVLRFIKPFESVSYASMSTVAVSDTQTRVEWIFNGKMKYPMNLMLLFMNMEKMIGGDLEKGLSNLKTLMEK